MMAPSFPSERKRVKAPKTGLLTCALSHPLPKIDVRISVGGDLLVAEVPDRCPASPFDERESSGAHSCGAVAGFHRFPEHPGDFWNSFAVRPEGRLVVAGELLHVMKLFSVT